MLYLFGGVRLDHHAKIFADALRVLPDDDCDIAEKTARQFLHYDAVLQTTLQQLFILFSCKLPEYQ